MSELLALLPPLALCSKPLVSPLCRIDTYTLDKWMVGTQKLFDESKSHVDIVGQASAKL